MATDIFARIGDIKGESADDRHRDEIDVLSWSWGLSQSSSNPGSGAAAGKIAFNDFNFTHRVDRASPMLMRACAIGQHLKDATITMRKAGKGQHEYLIIKMTDVLVANVQLGASGDEAATAENVALRFGKVELTYKPQKPDGSLDADVLFRYDVKSNKEG
jgi:type VI secretion system secreted protein Hcp